MGQSNTATTTEPKPRTVTTTISKFGKYGNSLDVEIEIDTEPYILILKLNNTTYMTLYALMEKSYRDSKALTYTVKGKDIVAIDEPPRYKCAGMVKAFSATYNGWFITIKPLYDEGGRGIDIILYLKRDHPDTATIYNNHLIIRKTSIFKYIKIEKDCSTTNLVVGIYNHKPQIHQSPVTIKGVIEVGRERNSWQLCELLTSRVTKKTRRLLIEKDKVNDVVIGGSYIISYTVMEDVLLVVSMTRVDDPKSMAPTL